ncbi:MAG: hypothetical protein HYZ43_02695, partial [Flavobacteriia bacterium]|nr:hypothetical protein [Flavobacteriia bacterium]
MQKTYETKLLAVKHLFSILICLSATITSAQSFDLKLLDKLNGPVQPSYDKPWQFMSNTVAPVAIATPVSMFIVGCATHDKELRIQSYNAGVSFLFANAVT